MIFAASASPMPGSVFNCARLALLMSTGFAGVVRAALSWAADALAAGALAAPEPAAAAGPAQTASASTTNADSMRPGVNRCIAQIMSTTRPCVDRKKPGGVAAAGLLAAALEHGRAVLQSCQSLLMRSRHFACIALMSATRPVSWQTMQVSVVASAKLRA